MEQAEVVQLHYLVRTNLKNLVITIDGFAGVGKSTVARKTARRLSLVHLNSGAIFRAIALKVLNSGLKTTAHEHILKMLPETELELRQVSNNTGDLGFDVLLDGVVLGAELLKENAGKGASEVAKFVEVRDFACRLQRKIAQSSSIVVEGRDTGTVIFPDADFKFFLTASDEASAKRRLGQLRPDIVEAIFKSPEKYQKELKEVEAEIYARNLRDKTRDIAPTIKADDAVEIDTSEISADEVVERIVQIVNPQLKN